MLFDLSTNFRISPRAKLVATKKLHDDLRRLWKDAVAAFVEVTAQHIPVDSGMSKASLMPLAANVRLKKALTIAVQNGKPKPGHGREAASFGFASNIGKFKSKTFGERLGKDAYVLTYGTKEKPIMVFKFEIPVLQWALNHIGIAAPEWGASAVALEEGRLAFRSFIDDNLDNYVDAKNLVNLIIRGN